MIAVCMPEFHGDVLWSVPAARELVRRHGCKADIYITLRGRETIDLLAYQSFVRRAKVTANYTDLHGSHDIAVYPFDYERVYQMGFQTSPTNCTLLDYFCMLVGLPRQGHWFEVPDPSESIPDGPFVVIAPKRQDGSMHARWGEMWRDFTRRCPLPVVEVGVPGGATAVEHGAIDRCRWGFLEMATIISKCKYFFGHISAPLVLADAMPNVVRVAVHDGRSWNLDACTKSPMNHYPVCYDADTLLRYIA